MASGDTALWLHNKLGSTDDLWSGKTICSQLNLERLQSIQECFHALQPHVKVKLLLSLLHLPRRNIEQWQEDLNIILQMAINDTDPWVSMIGEIMHNFPESGALNLNLHNSSTTFAEILTDLRKTVKKSAEVRMLPLECQYLNKAALTATAGQIPPLVKHFQIKRKPKSATLRAEILQKSTEVANNKKNNVPNSVPIKSRSFLKKMDTTTPMKGIPSRTPLSSSFRSSTPSSTNRLSGPSVTVTPLGNTWVTNKPGVNRKEGGVKFLDIGEQPVGAREAKKRKRQAELEALEQQKKEKEAAAAAAAAAPSTTAQTYTPDYAAGLVAPATPKMPTPMLSTPSSQSTQGPTYVPNTSRVQPTPATAATVGGVGALSTQQQARKNLQNQLQNTLGQPATVIRPATVTVAVTGHSVVVTNPTPTTVAAPAAATSTTTPAAAIVQPPTIIVQASPQGLQQQKLVTTQVRLPAGVQLQGQAQSPMISGQPVQVRLAAQPLAGQAAATQGPAVTATAAAQAAQPKKGLSLTRDQMMEAQEMFRVSNKVSRPEKALILGFMAGSRDNPCPQQGNVLNIKLSENEEVVMADGVEKKVVVDTYFQMNYGTGEWKRFKKFRDLPAS